MRRAFGGSSDLIAVSYQSRKIGYFSQIPGISSFVFIVELCINKIRQ